MKYFKVLINNEVVYIGTDIYYGEEITEEEYNTLLAEFEAKWEQEAEQNAPENPYGISDETYNNIVDDYTSSITSEVASNGY